MFQSFYTAIITSIQKSLRKGSGWIIDLAIDHTIIISKYKHWKQLYQITEIIRPSKKKDWLIFKILIIMNALNGVNIVRYLNPANKYPARITKADKDFAKKLDFKDIKFPVKIRGIHKIEKKTSIGISVFGYENNEKHPIYVSKKCCEEIHVDLLLIGEEGKRRYVLIKDFNTFMYDHILHQGKNIFVVTVYKLLEQKKH